MFGKRPPHDFHDEIESHLELEAERLRQQGLPPGQARDAARRAFGNTTRVEERYYESNRWAWLDLLRGHTLFAIRTLAKNPGFTTITILTLALGIGANTAIFSLMNAVMLRNLPVRNAQELVLFGEAKSSGDSTSLPDDDSQLFSYDMLHQFQRRTQVFSDVSAVRSDLFTMHGRVGSSADMEKFGVELVSGNYFTTLGVIPAMGRVLTSADDITPGGHPVAVANYSWWRLRFPRSPFTAGITVRIGGTVYTIVGVAADGFMGISPGHPPDLWVPLAMEKQISPGWTGLDNTLFESLWVFARLKPGVSMAQAGANTNLLFQQMIHEYAGPQATAKQLAQISHAHISLTPAANGIPRLRRHLSTALNILMAVVAAVLLIACANVANLLLARAAVRKREFALRMSIGAARFRLIQQLLVESSLLGLAGGALGVLLSWALSSGLLRMIFTGPDPLPLRVAPDLPVLAFALGATLLTVILFGTLPAWRATTIDLASSLKEGRGIAGAPLRNPLARSLVVAQVALSLALVTGAGIFLHSLSNLENINTGFNRNNALVADVDPTAGYHDKDRWTATMLRIEDRLAQVRGVTAASFALCVFDQGGWSSDVFVPGHIASNTDPDVDLNRIGIGYLGAMGMPILQGRNFSAHDTRESPKVAIVNETFARTYFPGVSPLGRTFSLEDDSKDIRIIGLVRDAKYIRLQEKPYAAAFFPYTQQQEFLGNLVVRYSGDARLVVPAIRHAVAEIDPNLPIGDFVPLSRMVDDSVQNSRIVAQLCTLFAALASMLAAIGIYGVLSYAIAHRTNEFGIRMALGAVRRDVLRMVLGDTLAMLSMGVVFGVALAIASGRLIESAVYGIKPVDPLSIALATAMMTLVGLFAGWLPARRATRIDPMKALRYE